MDAVDDRQDVASLPSCHQDLTPNSDATRLRLDPPTVEEGDGIKSCNSLAMKAGTRARDRDRDRSLTRLSPRANLVVIRQTALSSVNEGFYSTIRKRESCMQKVPLGGAGGV